MSLDVHTRFDIASARTIIDYQGRLELSAQLFVAGAQTEIADAFAAAGQEIGQATVRALLASPEAYALWAAAHDGAARGAWLKMRLESDVAC